MNVAVLARRYGHSTAYLGWLGNDAQGHVILDALDAEGVDTSHCRVIDGQQTAYSTVTLVDGDRVFGKSDHGVIWLTKLEVEDFAYIRNFDLVHTSVYSHLEDQIVDLKGASQRLSFDFSQNLEEEYLEKILPYVDIAFFSLADVNEEEKEALMHKVIRMGPSLVVMTRGKDGSWIFDGKRLYHQGIIPVEAVDTLGAGDAFAARFLVEYLDGSPIPLAMERAAQSAAENCTWFGAFGHGVSY